MYVTQKTIIPMHPIRMPSPIPKLPGRMTQNDRQADLELDLEIEILKKICHIKKE